MQTLEEAFFGWCISGGGRWRRRKRRRIRLHFTCWRSMKPAANNPQPLLTEDRHSVLYTLWRRSNSKPPLIKSPAIILAVPKMSYFITTYTFLTLCFNNKYMASAFCVKFSANV